MNPTANFNKFQSLVWGEAMRKARQQNGGKDATFGAAAGFAAGKTGKGRGSREGTGAANGDMSVEQGLARFQEAVGREQVFAKQTLGGQILQDETGNPNYMLGAFRGGESLSFHFSSPSFTFCFSPTSCIYFLGSSSLQLVLVLSALAHSLTLTLALSYHVLIFFITPAFLSTLLSSGIHKTPPTPH